MTATTTLYRVLRQSVYNGGCGHERVQSTEVLYCGYDRLEAVRAYHAAAPAARYPCPGNYGTDVRFQRKNVTA
jgi:hypothetical protein